MAGRPTTKNRTIEAGCYVCNGTSPLWTSGNAQSIAARHHDKTGHKTWCNVTVKIRYGVGVSQADKIPEN